MANQTYRNLKSGEIIRKGVKPLNVGEGYRVVGPEEIVKKGDQFNSVFGVKNPLTYWDNCQSEIGKPASTYGTAYVVRRKVEVPAPKLKAAPEYYYLQEGDIIRDTDEWFNLGNKNEWEPSNMWDGDKLWKDNVGKCRRKLGEPVEKTVAVTSRPCYIFLNIGETILEGDEFYAKDGMWLKAVSNVGRKCCESGEYRRKIN